MIKRQFYFAALLLTSLLSFSQNGEKNFIDQPYLQVTGKVETEIVPNEIYLSIVLDENDKKGKVSIETQENQMISTLKALGIDLEKNFSVLDYSGYYKRRFLGDNEVTKTKHYELIVNDGETLGKVYQALDRLDISNISITKLSHSDIENIRLETKLRALKKAKQKAHDYASAVGQTIGKALFIEELNENQNLSGLYGYAAGMLNETVVIRGVNSIEGYKGNDKIQNLNFAPLRIAAIMSVKFALN